MFAQKIAISNAALYGMKTDTHISGTQYSWGKLEHAVWPRKNMNRAKST
jgi:hypothetical protein